MIRDETTQTLDDVLTRFVDEHEKPHGSALKEFIRRYPQYERDLVNFAVAWELEENLPPPAAMSAEEEKSFVDCALSHLQNVLYARDKSAERGQGVTREGAELAMGLAAPTIKPSGSIPAETTPIVSIVTTAQALGVKPFELARACSLDLLLLGKLDACQILADTIPRRLVESIATALHRTPEVVEAFLAGPATFASNRALLSLRKPNPPTQQSFADAVRSSSLSAEQKRHWLDDAA